MYKIEKQKSPFIYKAIFRSIFFFHILIYLSVPLFAQQIEVKFDQSMNIREIFEIPLESSIPLFAVSINGEKIPSSDIFKNIPKNGIKAFLDSTSTTNESWTCRIILKNISNDTLTLSNFIPFGGMDNHVYITGKGNHPLSRAHLFRPGYTPVNVILPDNAWELGYASLQISNKGFAGLARRKYWNKGIRRRFETILPPDNEVIYKLYINSFDGNWQDGLKTVFQKKYLYDLDYFDNSLYEREDLKWISKAYAMHLLMAWDKDFYDQKEDKFTVHNFAKRNKLWFGGDEVIGIWPTWPTLGLDQRNQWDLFRDLPGGLDQLAAISDSLNFGGTKFFISYNPWDESTRLEDHLKGMSELIKNTHADGVVLDTKGSSSRELQEAADSVSDGVIMYSEGMAVPKDMPGIVSGRVHNALYYPPLLNLNKLIKPDFAIFRVAELAYERIRREYAISFFNGYGTELNLFRPGRPEWIEEDYRFFGKTLRILRENHSNFISYDFTPLIPTQIDSVYVNKWPTDSKTIYTIFSLLPEGFSDELFEVEKPKEGWHYVDIWNHELLETKEEGAKYFIHSEIEGFHKKWLGTNNEGAVGSIAYLPVLLKVNLVGNKLLVNADFGTEIRIWKGNPSYGEDPLVKPVAQNEIDIFEHFERFEGKLVVQLFDNEELLDEQIIRTGYGIPRLVSNSNKIKASEKSTKGMVKIPAGSFEMQVSQGDQFIPYPTFGYPKRVEIEGFYIDKHPVTNAQFQEFIKMTNYIPQDQHRFLAHWENGKIPKGKENHPVVNVSYEDALAFAKWVGKRLPTEEEWQYAASSGDGRDWPWDKGLQVNKRIEYVTNTLTVEHLDGLDTGKVNIGNGILDPVGTFPNGANPWGLEDLVGSVWQMTNDIYDNGTNRMIILKGGSYYKPSSSWWYVQGGPRETHYRQVLLRVSGGFERNETVGFRCVADL